MAGELSDETSALLCRLGLHERVGPVFAREGIDEDSLLFMSVEDLVGVGVAAEDARRIVSAVAVPDAEPVEAVAVVAMSQEKGQGNVSSKSAIYGDKLKGISPENAVDALEHGLALCQATRIRALDSATYHAKFVPAFMARRGIEDVNDMPSRSTLQDFYQSHLAKKEEEKTKEESETYRPMTSSRRQRLAPVTKSPKDELAESMAPVRDAMGKATTALQKASGGKNKTQGALRVLGFSGDGVLGSAAAFHFDERDYAIRQVKRALPDEDCLDLESMTTAREVWLAFIKNCQGLGDGALEKQISATRERCEDLKFERQSAKPQNACDARVALAGGAARKKQRVEDLEANKDADHDLRSFEIFDDEGLKPTASNPFRRMRRTVVPKKLPGLYEVGKPVWAVDLQTNEPILVKSGPKKLKLAMCAGSSFQLGAGVKRGDQEPIAIIERTGPETGAVMVDDAWCGGCLLPDGTKVSHRGQDGPGALLIDVSQKPLTWVNGGEDNPFDALSELGLSLASSEAVISAQFGTLCPFQCVTFEDTGCIPGGLVGLDRECKRLMSRMRDAVTAHADDPGTVHLAEGVPLQKLAKNGRALDESNYRFNILAEPQRCAGEINDETLAKLNWLKVERFDALYSVAYSAALLGYVQVRVLAYAHEGAGRFHFDSAADGPKVSKRMATALVAADPANLDSLNFSLEDCPVPARMGPVLGPT